jgi:hypothetical protein
MRDAFKLDFIAALHSTRESSPSRNLFELEAHAYNQQRYEALLRSVFPSVYEELAREGDSAAGEPSQ